MELTVRKALELAGDLDVTDSVWDVLCAWCAPEDMDDSYDRVCAWIMDRIELIDVDKGNCWMCCNINKFCLEHWEMMKDIFVFAFDQRLSNDPDDEAYYDSEEDLPLLYLGTDEDKNKDGKYTTGEPSLYHAVQAINGIMSGNISDKFYDWFENKYMKEGETE